MKDDNVTELADATGVMNLLAAYAQHCDDDRFDDFEGLFSEDCVLRVAGDEVYGAAAIRAFVEGHQRAGLRGKHLIGNLRTEFDGDTASASSDFFFFQWVDGGLRVTRSGRYQDQLRRNGDGWQFVRHEVTFTPRRPPASLEAAGS